MNGKRAKQLRRMAKENTAEGQAEKDFAYVERIRLNNTKNKRRGKQFQLVTIPGTTKAEANKLKSDYNESRRKGPCPTR